MEDTETMRGLAESGNAKAQLQMGLRYALGRGVPQDEEKLWNGVRKSAEQGFAPAKMEFFLKLSGKRCEQ